MSTALAALPATGDAQQWTAQEAALMEAVGLVQRKGRETVIAPRAVAEAFLAHCRRSGLDPVARQIYCIERGGKYQTQVSIDGARLVAERSGQYRGQTPTQWTADGVVWVDVWLAEGNPAAARVGVRRDGFDEPLYAVATWREYAVANGQMWKKMPALMLGKVAEMLALRKAFPQDLSGLYSAEEMAQSAPAAAAVEAPVEAVVEPVADPVWPEARVRMFLDQISRTVDLVKLRGFYDEAERAGMLGAEIDTKGTTIGHVVMERKRAIENPEPEAPVVPEEEETPPADEPMVLEGMDAEERP